MIFDSVNFCDVRKRRDIDEYSKLQILQVIARKSATINSSDLFSKTNTAIAGYCTLAAAYRKHFHVQL